MPRQCTASFHSAARGETASRRTIRWSFSGIGKRPKAFAFATCRGEDGRQGLSRRYRRSVLERPAPKG